MFEHLQRRRKRITCLATTFQRKKHLHKGSTVALLTPVVVIDDIPRLSAAGLRTDPLIPSKKPKEGPTRAMNPASSFPTTIQEWGPARMPEEIKVHVHSGAFTYIASEDRRIAMVWPNFFFFFLTLRRKQRVSDAKNPPRCAGVTGHGICRWELWGCGGMRVMYVFVGDSTERGFVNTNDDDSVVKRSRNSF